MSRQGKGICKGTIRGAPGNTSMVSTDRLLWPSLLWTVYATGGTAPAKPTAGVKTHWPSGRMIIVPATTPVVGSVMVRGVEPGANTCVLPGRLKAMTLVVVPDGAAVLRSRLPDTGAP